MNKLAFLAVALSLAACGSEESGAIASGDGEVGVTADAQDGETSMTFTSDEGEVKITGGTGQNVDLPEGFSVYPGSTVINSSQVSHDQGSGVRIAMQTVDSADQAIDYYRKQAAAQGIAITSDVSNNNTRLAGGEGPDGTTLSVTAIEGDGETTVNLIVAKGF